MFEVDKIRSFFPALNQKVNGSRLVYFDNAATMQKPKQVIDELVNYYQAENSNIHRGAHYLSQRATESFEKTRIAVQKFINAKHSHEIIFTKGTTESINLVASSLKSFLKKGDEIIISEMEHHSNIVPWQLCCQQTGVILKTVPILENGELDISALKNILSSKTKLLAISHISNVLGTINPIEDIVELCHKKSIKVLIDGAQASAHYKIDVQKIGADFYCFSSHKMYGPTGVGVLYGKEELLRKLPPYQGGGEMVESVSFKKTTYANLPYKFEAGTPNIGGVISFKKAISFIEKIGFESIKKHEKELLLYATEGLMKIEGLKIYGTSESKCCVVSFNIDNIHSYDIGTILDKMGVAIRTGHHCAQPIMNRFDILGTARLSFAMYNTKDEIDECLLAIKKTKKMLK